VLALIARVRKCQPERSEGFIANAMYSNKLRDSSPFGSE